jgi:hypothetical protein
MGAFDVPQRVVFEAGVVAQLENQIRAAERSLIRICEQRKSTASENCEREPSAID